MYSLNIFYKSHFYIQLIIQNQQNIYVYIIRWNLKIFLQDLLIFIPSLHYPTKKLQKHKAKELLYTKLITSERNNLRPLLNASPQNSAPPNRPRHKAVTPTGKFYALDLREAFNAVQLGRPRLAPYQDRLRASPGKSLVAPGPHPRRRTRPRRNNRPIPLQLGKPCTAAERAAAGHSLCPPQTIP